MSLSPCITIQKTKVIFFKRIKKNFKVFTRKKYLRTLEFNHMKYYKIKLMKFAIISNQEEF